jgi:hypothetical protein
MTTIALFGAGGKMGCRIGDNLRRSGHNMLYVEIGDAGVQRLAERGLTVTAPDDAIARADVVILALPDRYLGKSAWEIVPKLKPGTLVILLDPAAPYAGELPARADIAYFVTHPCHPPIFNDETGDARRDFFGGVAAKQNIVCALMQGPESDYARGESIAKLMYAPVMNAHRVTVEQMAILEPALSETVCGACVTVIREAVDEAVRRGVPESAARAFILGHLNVELAIVFDEVGSPFSDGAKLIIEYGKKHIFQEDWRKVFEPESVREQVEAIVNQK